MNYSAGVRARAGASLAITVDYYRIDDQQPDRAVRQLHRQRRSRRCSPAPARWRRGGRFFTNAIDTRSNGVDVVANYGVTAWLEPLGPQAHVGLQPQHREGDARRLDAARSSGRSRRICSAASSARASKAATRATTCSISANYCVGGLGLTRANAALRRSVASPARRRRTRRARSIRRTARRWITDLARRTHCGAVRRHGRARTTCSTSIPTGTSILAIRRPGMAGSRTSGSSRTTAFRRSASTGGSSTRS